MVLDKLTILMLGLEKQLWDEVSQSEKRFYIRAVLYFLIFIFLATNSGIALFFFITSSILIAIPVGFVLALVVGTIVRFSLVILRKSIFDPEKIKQEKKDATAEKTSSEIVENKKSNLNHVSVKENISSKIDKISSKLKQLFTKFSKIKFPKSDTPIPVLTVIIRFSIIGVMGLLVLFPLACILHFQKIREINQSRRESCINQYIKDAEKSIEMKTAYLKLSIINTQNEIKEQKGLLKEKTAQLNILNQQLNNIIDKHNQELQVNLKAYTEDIQHRYFIVHSFKAVTKLPYFFPTMLLIFWVLISPHLILQRLKTDKKFAYAEISTKYYKQIIEEKYNENQKYILKFLNDKFQYTPQNGYETMIWENPPYNTKKSEHFKMRNKLSKDEFLKSLIKPSI
jgi:hypothetical protein